MAIAIIVITAADRDSSSFFDIFIGYLLFPVFKASGIKYLDMNIIPHTSFLSTKREKPQEGNNVSLWNNNLI